VPLSANDAALLPGLFQGARYPAEVTYDFGGRRYRWEAYVDRADGLLNDETRTIDVYLRVPRPISGGALAADQGPAAKTERNGGSRTKAPPLLVGSFVGVSISGETRARYAIVPLSALRSDDRIWAVRDGKVAILDVSVIQRDDNFAYLEGAGIPANAKLITGGLDIATNGMKVRVASKQNGSAKSRKASPAAGAPRE